jgi:hypothetical protein
MAWYERSVFQASNEITKLWKNGEEQNLTDGTFRAGAYSVFVSGNDVYVAGYINNASYRRVAKLWKNGEPQTITGGIVANSVFVVE